MFVTHERRERYAAFIFLWRRRFGANGAVSAGTGFGGDTDASRTGCVFAWAFGDVITDVMVDVKAHSRLHGLLRQKHHRRRQSIIDCMHHDRRQQRLRAHPRPAQHHTEHKNLRQFVPVVLHMQRGE